MKRDTPHMTPCTWTNVIVTLYVSRYINEENEYEKKEHGKFH